MVLLTLNELEVNAVSAALDDRLQKMSQQRWALKEQRDTYDNRFALEATDAAIRDVMRAKATLVAALPEPEYPADASFDRFTVIELYQGGQ